jgi:hypothetical protein
MPVVSLSEALEHWWARYADGVVASEPSILQDAPRQAELPFRDAPDTGKYGPANMGRREVKRARRGRRPIPSSR